MVGRILFAVALFFFVVQSQLLAQTQTPTPHWITETIISQPTDDFDPVWSPDGGKIAFVGHETGDPEVYVRDLVSGDTKNISADSKDDYAPVWSPDGQYLAFFHRKQPYSPQPNIVRVADMATGEVFDASEENLIYELGWKDGALVIAQGDGIWSVDLRTHERTMIYRLPTANQYYFSVIAPDGNFVAIALWDKTSYTIMRLALLNTESATSTEMSVTEPQNLAWSLDSRYLAFTTGGFPNKIDLHIVDTQSQTDRVVEQISEGFINNLVWSPTNRLAWTSNRGNELTIALYVIDASADTTTPPTRLNIVPAITRLIWSPTHNHLAFQTYAGIYVMDGESGTFSELVQGIGMIQRIEWSADGNYLASIIYGVAGNAGGGDAVVVDIRDRDQRYLYETGYFVGDPQWSPVGDRLIFSSGFNAKDTDIIALTLEP